ncbi:protein kinase domain containing protein, partial [Entamoeba invadens IP1]
CLSKNVENIDIRCKTYNQFGCYECASSYYYNSQTYTCENCDEKCQTCVSKSSQCLSCNASTFLYNSSCLSIENLSHNCEQFAHSGGCVKCKDGYYRYGLQCFSCNIKCSTCLNGVNCLSCNSTNYKTIKGDCIPQDLILNCETEVTQNGCSRCQIGFYTINSNECEKCDDNCYSCSSKHICTSCLSSQILSANNSCVGLSSISKCLEIDASKCVQCTFWHSPSVNGTFCEVHSVWWVILILVIVIVYFIITIVFVFSITTKKIIEKININDIECNTTIFSMSNSNIKFIPFQRGICVSSKDIDFNSEHQEIEVNVETKEVICVGNISNETIKIQFSMSSEISKFSIRVDPEVICLKPKFACEFSIYIKPLCTCVIKNKIMIFSKGLKTNKEVSGELNLQGVTSFSTRMDYEELIEEKKLGEGSFGVVFKGNYRGNLVAIKKMKSTTHNEEALEDFEKEVSMLDKFRSEYIVHFYGAVFIPNKMCIVTELADFGSLNDLIQQTLSNKKALLNEMNESNNKNKNTKNNKKKNTKTLNYEIFTQKDSLKLKVKFMKDVSKGILYLHSNGVLHRDIKPDNILIFSLYADERINAKLTDFGSSRNINLLMTNMTFTKGVGTPVYMAPEILNQKKYKKPEDIYSFGMTMFECFKWGEAYPVEQFEYPWIVADFVISGKRLEKPEEMDERCFDIIKRCWCQDPAQRIKIEQVCDELDILYNSF